MKKLIFVRHGRAEEPGPMFSDSERSLTTKGKVISRQMAISLKEREHDPGTFISSPAFRALETALIFADEFAISPDNIILKNNLYFKVNLGSFALMLEEIGDKTDKIILFGHNPAFTEIPDRLSYTGCDFMPKSGIVCLSFKSDSWKGVMHEKGKKEYFIKPDKAL